MRRDTAISLRAAATRIVAQVGLSLLPGYATADQAQGSKWTDPVTLFTVCLVAVGIVQIVVYWKQKGVMERALRATDSRPMLLNNLQKLNGERQCPRLCFCDWDFFQALE